MTALGRWCLSNNTATHTVKLVNAATKVDVPNGTATISLAGAPPGQFRYGALANPVTLAANTAYYLVSQEISGGDQWYYYNTRLTTTPVAQCQGAAYLLGAAWGTAGATNNTLGPVDFNYASANVAAINPQPEPQLLLRLLDGGVVHLRVEMENAGACQIRSSTNLLDWELIGAALPGPNGLIEFDYTNTQNFSQRFFRVVRP